MSVAVAIAAVSLAIWIYLILGRGGFWRVQLWDADAPSNEPAAWPRVAAVIPARNEADMMPDTLV